MSPFLYPIKLFDTVVDHIVVVIGVVVLSQIPAYMDHYAQRLGGHVAEARQNVEGWGSIADKVCGGDVEQLAAVYLASPSAEVAEAGRKCESDLARYDALSVSLVALTTADGWSRPFTFLRTVDVEVAEGALASYVPGIPLDLEGLAYALVGLFLSLLIYRALRGTTVGVCRACGRRLKQGRPQCDTPVSEA